MIKTINKLVAQFRFSLLNEADRNLESRYSVIICLEAIAAISAQENSVTKVSEDDFRLINITAKKLQVDSGYYDSSIRQRFLKKMLPKADYSYLEIVLSNLPADVKTFTIKQALILYSNRESLLNLLDQNGNYILKGKYMTEIERFSYMMGINLELEGLVREVCSSLYFSEKTEIKDSTQAMVNSFDIKQRFAILEMLMVFVDTDALPGAAQNKLLIDTAVTLQINVDEIIDLTPLEKEGIIANCNSDQLQFIVSLLKEMVALTDWPRPTLIAYGFILKSFGLSKVEIDEIGVGYVLDVDQSAEGAADKIVDKDINVFGNEDIDETIEKMLSSMEKNISNASDGFDGYLSYWYNIITQVSVQQPLDFDKPINEQIKENVYGNCDEYLNRDDIQNSSKDEIEGFVKMRIYSYGELYTVLSSLHLEIEGLLSENSEASHPSLSKLLTESSHAKARTYGAIKLALRHKVPKEKITEWFPAFEDDQGLIDGINPFERLAESLDLDLPSTTKQYDLSGEELKHIPQWYKGPVENEGRIIYNLSLTRAVKLSRFESTIYGLVESYIEVLAALAIDVSDDKDLDDSDNPLVLYAKEQIDLGLNWLKSTNIDAFNILQRAQAGANILDEIKELGYEIAPDGSLTNPRTEDESTGGDLSNALFNGLQNSSSTESSESYFEVTLDRALRKYNASDYEGALEDLETTVSMNPRNRGQYNLRGLCRGALKDFEGSIEEYNKALEIDFEYTTALLNRGDSKANLGLTLAAFKDYIKATEIDPTIAYAWDCCGLQKQQLKEFEESIPYFTQAIELESENSNYYLSRGISKVSTGDLAGAKADLIIAASYGNSNAKLLLNNDHDTFKDL
jgi:tetratricopeptide (TPR) repeat protein